MLPNFSKHRLARGKSYSTYIMYKTRTDIKSYKLASKKIFSTQNISKKKFYLNNSKSVLELRLQFANQKETEKNSRVNF